MKREINIADFLKTGKFGEVELHDSMEVVLTKLGKPDGEHNPDAIKPYTGIHYSMYELLFRDGKLDSIQNDHYNTNQPEMTEFENDTFRINSQFMKADKVKKMREIKTWLEESKIKYEVIDYWGRRALKTVGNVVIDFDNEIWSEKNDAFLKIKDENNFRLIGIRYFPNSE